MNCLSVFGHHFVGLAPKKLSQLDTLKQFIDNLPTNCLSVFGHHFVGLAPEVLSQLINFFSPKESQ